MIADAETRCRGLLAAWVADRSPRSVDQAAVLPEDPGSPAGRVACARYGSRGAAASSRLPGRSSCWPAARSRTLRSGRHRGSRSSPFAGPQGAAVLARSLPDSRTIFILRHPCGQVASVMRGNRQRRFDLRTAGTDMPFDEARRRCASPAAHGVDAPAFQALPEAAKYAWSWRAFNEPAYARAGGHAERPCRASTRPCVPTRKRRRGGSWPSPAWTGQSRPRTSLLQSTAATPRPAGYYSIFRDAARGCRKPGARRWPVVRSGGGASGADRVYRWRIFGQISRFQRGDNRVTMPGRTRHTCSVNVLAPPKARLAIEVVHDLVCPVVLPRRAAADAHPAAAARPRCSS